MKNEWIVETYREGIGGSRTHYATKEEAVTSAEQDRTDFEARGLEEWEYSIMVYSAQE